MTSGLFPKKEPTGNWWVDHSLTLALFGMLLFMVVADFIMTWFMEHMKSPPFYLVWAHDIWESLAAEPLGVIIPVLFTKWFIERGSKESK